MREIKRLENMKRNKLDEENLISARNNKNVREIYLFSKNLNPWDRVVEHIDIKESEYKGSNDVKRMRDVILTRKQDYRMKIGK